VPLLCVEWNAKPYVLAEDADGIVWSELCWRVVCVQRGLSAWICTVQHSSFIRHASPLGSLVCRPLCSIFRCPHSTGCHGVNTRYRIRCAVVTESVWLMDKCIPNNQSEVKFAVQLSASCLSKIIVYVVQKLCSQAQVLRFSRHHIGLSASASSVNSCFLAYCLSAHVLSH